jgi:NADH:ubiquinone oxidoreductase subunit 6 (subunit J)
VFIFVIVNADWSTVPSDRGVEGRGGLSAAELGEALLTTWSLPFLLASVLLTAALIGSIMLARSSEEDAEDALA